jgi:hypothetical protein
MVASFNNDDDNNNNNNEDGRILRIASCSHVEVDRCFKSAYCLHHHRPDGGGSKHI